MQHIQLPESAPAIIEGQPLRVRVDKGITADALQARLIELQERAPIVELHTSHHCGLRTLPDISFLESLRTLHVPDPWVRKFPARFPTSLRDLHLAHLTDASWMQGHAFNEARLSGPLRTLNIQTSFLWLQRCTRLASLSGKVRVMWIQSSAVKLSELRNLEGLESLDCSVTTEANTYRSLWDAPRYDASHSPRFAV